MSEARPQSETQGRPQSRPDRLCVLVVYVPTSDAEALRAVLAEAGAGALGDYRGCSWSVTGTGRFTPVDGANPAIGEVGTPEQVQEDRIEVVVAREQARAVTAAMIAAHPYEEPAYHLIPVLTLEDL